MATKKTLQSKNVKTLKADASILIKPRITEKAARASEKNTYVFDVAVGSTKTEIKKAFVMLYGHLPTKIRTVNKKGDYVFRRNVLGKTARTKKAYIYLPKGVTIEVM